MTSQFCSERLSDYTVITVTAYVDAKAAYGVDRTGLSCADQQ